jgi:hypothetical protein
MSTSNIIQRFVLISAVVICTGCGSPTTPCVDQYGRGNTMLNDVAVHCASDGVQLDCGAQADIAGLYVYCPQQQVVTTEAQWLVGDSAIVATVAPGVFTAVSPGHTFIHAVWQRIDSGNTPVAVFAGTPLVMTGQISGHVSESGQAAPIDGAVVEVTNGLIAGTTSTSGVRPPSVPGYADYVFQGPGFYLIEGMPSGTYHLRITKSGYVSQERDVTLGVPNGAAGGPTAPVDFQLVRQ